MAWVTHSLGLAVAATALVAVGSSTARGQSPAAQTQDPPRPAPSAADEDTFRDRRRGPSGTTFGSLSLFDNRRTDSPEPTFVENAWQSSVEVKCIGCRGFETTVVRPQSTTATAPWALRGRWQRHTTLGVVSTGFLGVRNYALPLFTAIPLGGDLDHAALRTSGGSMDATVSQWSLTAGIEKTLFKRENGASVGVAGDLLMPFKTDTIGVDDPRNTALDSPTMRLGIIFRW
jgi:hypothetical protein